MRNKQIAIIGATGFTGAELVRILHHHPYVDISVITSESRNGEHFSDVHPYFEGIEDITLESVENIGEFDIDMVFLALPHGVSMTYAKRLLDEDVPVIDLSGDFRLSSPEIYSEWYHQEHTFPEGFETAVYGIPELFRSEITHTSLIANPGCYPTSIILGIAPLLIENLADPSMIIADSKSGVTGAGIKAKPVNHFSAVNDNFKAYGLTSHRHSIEIQEQLSELSGGSATIQFTPHLLPIDRGILSTIYLRPAHREIDDEQIKNAYIKHYEEQPFIRLRNQPPAVKDVRGTNLCDIHVTYDSRTGNIIVISAIDNLVKGAAGQAVQNMNIYFNWEETAGLQHIPLNP